MRITANGININYVLEGPESAPVVTLSHSLAADLGMWDAQSSALAGTYRVLRYDMRGHGGTDAPAGAYTIDQLAEDALELLSALRIDRTHFVGLSMGGMIGQTLALTHPDLFRSLVLCDTFSRVPAEAVPLWHERIVTAERDGMEATVEPTIARWFSADFIRNQPVECDRVRDMIRNTPVAGYGGCCHAISELNLTGRLSQINAPTLIIVGEDDPGAPVAASEDIHERIAGSRLVVLKSARHLSNIEQADSFNTALTEFLATLEP
jgi:3-oxoadipate enol-lactonase